MFRAFILLHFLSVPAWILPQAAKRDGVRVDAAGEREILIKAVRVNTLSKLTYGDTHLFLALIGDVFPGAESSDIPGVRKERTPCFQDANKRLPRAIVGVPDGENSASCARAPLRKGRTQLIITLPVREFDVKRRLYGK